MDSAGPTRPPLDRERLTASDPAPVEGLRIEVLDEVASTNAEVARRAVLGADAGLVVVAEQQTAGRGRLDRHWHSPPRSSLILSTLLRPDAPSAAWAWLPLLTGVAVATALRSRGFATDLKWPNDVLLAERKLAGILLERVETPRGPAAVVGIGLNVSLGVDELPVPTATSLLLASGTEPDRDDLLVGLLTELRDTFAQWAAEPGAESLRERYRAACLSVGREVRVELPTGRTLAGRAVDVDAGGRLVVDVDGTTTAVAAGDVIHARLQGRT